MKLKLKSFLFALAFGFALNANAQDGYFKCGHDAYTHKLWAEHPELKTGFQQVIENSKAFEANGFQAKSDTTFYIPIVFHILHEYGTENITDAQVYDAVAILNRDYRKLNADVANAVAGFGAIAANTEIQFRLASIDPYGNCTNGIEHIYTHETTQGDDFSKLNQWHRSKYLNVWISQKIGSEGAAGYAFYPSGVEGNAFFRDGIIINPTYIGSIGTGSPYSSRALTHEVGHYLALSHVWGDNNNPGEGVECGDDGIEDTPKTKGYNFCPSNENAAKLCDPNIVENYQNYMEYSYCSVMFTNNQSQRMRSVLLGETSGRNNLVLDSNLIATGTTTDIAPLCAPVADFNQKTRYTCVGGSVTFTDISWNAATTNRTWRFEGGSPATSTSATQAVTFDSPGYKKVTLVVGNATGQDSIVNEKSIYVSGNWGDLTGPSTEDFEGQYPLALVENPENNYAKWHVVSGVNGISGAGSKAMKLNNFKNTTGAQLFTEDYFYNFRLGGNKDAIITPSFDLRYTTNTQLTFDYAYATNASTIDELTEEMIVYSSSNCGTTWQQRKKINKAELLTGGNSTGVDFVPNGPSQWKTMVVDIPSALALNKSNTRFKIEFITSDVSNNVYIDNIRMNGVLGLEESPIEAMNINVYPNPTSSATGINIEYVANNEAIQFQLLDIQGKVISTESNSTTNTSVTHKMNVNSALATGCYYLKITQGDFSATKKVVVL